MIFSIGFHDTTQSWFSSLLRGCSFSLKLFFQLTSKFLSIIRPSFRSSSPYIHTLQVNSLNFMALKSIYIHIPSKLKLQPSTLSEYLLPAFLKASMRFLVKCLIVIPEFLVFLSKMVPSIIYLLRQKSGIIFNIPVSLT